ncbi:hypothetical protein VN97_g4005 [Penicillium thymicola]|uniref:Uncharacterized protein n=1 Tax=Penicillium thymicola TaxID=293382 RepID=A0AAI9TM00_PENTH|nr:hypothetical protein VN97_g4005 [Penicillium thymicola]
MRIRRNRKKSPLPTSISLSHTTSFLSMATTFGLERFLIQPEIISAPGSVSNLSKLAERSPDSGSLRS